MGEGNEENWREGKDGDDEKEFEWQKKWNFTDVWDNMKSICHQKYSLFISKGGLAVLSGEKL